MAWQILQMEYVGVAGLHAMCYLLGNSMNDQNLLYISYQIKFHTEDFLHCTGRGPVLYGKPSVPPNIKQRI